MIISGVLINQRTVAQPISTRHFAQTLLILLGLILRAMIINSSMVHISALRASNTACNIVVTYQTLRVELFHRTMALLSSFTSILLIRISALTVIRHLTHT